MIFSHAQISAENQQLKKLKAGITHKKCYMNKTLITFASRCLHHSEYTRWQHRQWQSHASVAIYGFMMSECSWVHNLFPIYVSINLLILSHIHQHISLFFNLNPSESTIVPLSNWNYSDGKSSIWNICTLLSFYLIGVNSTKKVHYEL